jgi:uracil-DNA glycosylase family 4
MSIYNSYQEFELKKSSCRECPVGLVYNCVVLSDGCKENPVVMISGESPGSEELTKGLPFVGKAGKLLRSTLNKFGFRTYNTIITNVIPCRPLDNKFPTDTKMVQECVERWLSVEMDILKPKFMILLGNQPFKFVLGKSGITSWRGTWFEKDGIKMMPTYHPSYVIRKSHMSDGEDVKAEFEADISLVAEAAGFSLPVA